ncbi:MAG: signal peptidase II, partial [Bacillota bacterium]
MVYIISVIIILLDQWIKFLIDNSFQYGQSYPIIQNKFHLTYVRNSGAAFGIFKEYTYLFIIFSIFIIIFLLYLLYRSPKNIIFEIGMGMILGGAIGNLIDRIRLGFVIDYIDIHIWPIFNLADIFVTLGIIIFLYFIWKDRSILE